MLALLGASVPRPSPFRHLPPGTGSEGVSPIQVSGATRDRSRRSRFHPGVSLDPGQIKLIYILHYTLHEASGGVAIDNAVVKG